MGKSELLMILTGIALSIMIALITIPTFTKGSDVAKISLINSDISSIRKVSQTYVESKSPTGDFENINAKALSSLIPGLELVKIDDDNSYFISSANEKIKYIIGTKDEIDDIDYSVLILKIEGLNEIDGAKKSILKTQGKLNINATYDPDLDEFIPNDKPGDGVLILHFKG